MHLFSLLPKHTQKHVAIIIDQDQLTCAWLEQPNYRAPFSIKAYEKKVLDTPNSSDCLFNPTAIGATISDFIKTQVRKQTLISCAFTPALITERLVKLNHATPSPADFPRHHTSHVARWPSNTEHTHTQRNQAQYTAGSQTSASHAAAPTLWDYHYLYPTDTHEYVFYMCGIAQSLLLQYKLMALTHTFNLLTTTTQTAALLQLYRYTHGAAFRSSQLGIDMQRAHNNPELLFSDELARRVISMPEYNSGENKLGEDKLKEDMLIDKKTALTLAGLMAQALSS